ncbi:MAG: hypothetical protein PF489_12055 [Salinivirgaceae bacterium]|jgi:hypothetical protein|nr:hypothetical protein [Salinivirgaceae bacterium]
MKKFEISIIKEPDTFTDSDLSVILGGKKSNGSYCWCGFNKGNQPLDCDKEHRKLKFFYKEEGVVFCVINVICAEEEQKEQKE